MKMWSFQCQDKAQICKKCFFFSKTITMNTTDTVWFGYNLDKILYTMRELLNRYPVSLVCRFFQGMAVRTRFMFGEHC